MQSHTLLDLSIKNYYKDRTSDNIKEIAEDLKKSEAAEELYDLYADILKTAKENDWSSKEAVGMRADKRIYHLIREILEAIETNLRSKYFLNLDEAKEKFQRFANITFEQGEEEALAFAISRAPENLNKVFEERKIDPIEMGFIFQEQIYRSELAEKFFQKSKDPLALYCLKYYGHNETIDGSPDVQVDILVKSREALHRYKFAPKDMQKKIEEALFEIATEEESKFKPEEKSAKITAQLKYCEFVAAEAYKYADQVENVISIFNRLAIIKNTLTEEQKKSCEKSLAQLSVAYQKGLLNRENFDEITVKNLTALHEDFKDFDPLANLKWHYATSSVGNPGSKGLWLNEPEDQFIFEKIKTEFIDEKKYPAKVVDAAKLAFNDYQLLDDPSFANLFSFEENLKKTAHYKKPDFKSHDFSRGFMKVLSGTGLSFKEYQSLILKPSEVKRASSLFADTAKKLESESVFSAYFYLHAAQATLALSNLSLAIDYYGKAIEKLKKPADLEVVIKELDGLYTQVTESKDEKIKKQYITLLTKSANQSAFEFPTIYRPLISKILSSPYKIDFEFLNMCPTFSKEFLEPVVKRIFNSTDYSLAEKREFFENHEDLLPKEFEFMRRITESKEDNIATVFDILEENKKHDHPVFKQKMDEWIKEFAGKITELKKEERNKFFLKLAEWTSKNIPLADYAKQALLKHWQQAKDEQQKMLAHFYHFELNLSEQSAAEEEKQFTNKLLNEQTEIISQLLLDLRSKKATSLIEIMGGPDEVKTWQKVALKKLQTRSQLSLRNAKSIEELFSRVQANHDIYDIIQREKLSNLLEDKNPWKHKTEILKAANEDQLLALHFLTNTNEKNQLTFKQKLLLNLKTAVLIATVPPDEYEKHFKIPAEKVIEIQALALMALATTQEALLKNDQIKADEKASLEKFVAFGINLANDSALPKISKAIQENCREKMLEMKENKFIYVETLLQAAIKCNTIDSGMLMKTYAECDAPNKLRPSTQAVLETAAKEIKKLEAEKKEKAGSQNMRLFGSTEFKRAEVRKQKKEQPKPGSPTV